MRNIISWLFVRRRELQDTLLGAALLGNSRLRTNHVPTELLTPSLSLYRVVLRRNPIQQEVGGTSPPIDIARALLMGQTP